MSIEALKEQARRHEQKEEWRKALDQYKKAIAKLDADDQPDIGLYNRVGDLFVRVGNLDEAVEHYERAVDLYLEAELANNAIAVCKKIIRNVPERPFAYLRIGQIRAQQGFIPDARTNFLTYAERMQQAGDLDESFRALVEFCDLAPEEVDVRAAVADQMASSERVDEAIAQFSIVYRKMMLRGQTDGAAAIEAKVRELNPEADLDAAPEIAPVGVSGDDGEIGGAFGEIEFGSEVAEAEGAEDGDAAGGDTDEGGVEIPSFEIAVEGDEEGADDAAEEEAVVDIPLMDFSSDDGEADAGEADDEGDAVELPLMDFDSEEDEADEGEAVDLPLMDFSSEEDEAGGVTLDASAFGEADHGEREVQEYVEGPDEMEEVDVGLAEVAPAMADGALEEAMEDAASEASAAGDVPTIDAVRARIEQEPDDVALRQRMVELAYQSGEEGVLVEAYLGLGQTLDRQQQATQAKAAYRQVLQVDPDNEVAKAALGDAAAGAQPVKEVAAHEDYVDLGALILGDSEEKTTRFVVAYEEPSGDEAADFAKMLSQFKEKVSENLGADDVKAHHDLGTAYMEMGLLDEAVAEFQQALRASADHLPTYELLGQTFMDMGNTEAAIRSLERALEVDHEIEDDLVGIYYYLARAYEVVGNKDSALEFYDRVFTLDINFADVTERLRALR